jgi:hypothetical protein
LISTGTNPPLPASTGTLNFNAAPLPRWAWGYPGSPAGPSAAPPQRPLRLIYQSGSRTRAVAAFRAHRYVDPSATSSMALGGEIGVFRPIQAN